MLCTLEAQPTVIKEIRVAQAANPQLEQIREKILVGKAPEFVIHKDGTIQFHNRVCVPIVEALKRKILDECHNTPYSMHPGGNKLYKDLKQTFWWSNMKQEVADYVAKCLTCQRVKIEHQRPVRLLQPLDVPKWKWGSISMDFVVGLLLTQRKNNAICVIVVRLTNGAFYSHKEYLDTGPVSSSLPRGDSATIWSAQLHSIGLRHQILVEFLAEATGSIWDVITLYHCLSPICGRAN